jgi:hypothetical protein
MAKNPKPVRNTEKKGGNIAGLRVAKDPKGKTVQYQLSKGKNPPLVNDNSRVSLGVRKVEGVKTNAQMKSAIRKGAVTKKKP